MKRFLISLVIMVICFFIAGLFLLNTGIFGVDGNINKERAKDIAIELDNIPFIDIDVSDDDICIDHSHNPVCGEMMVQCITAPCNPVQQTFDNWCDAKSAGAKNIREGPCFA